MKILFALAAILGLAAAGTGAFLATNNSNIEDPNITADEAGKIVTDLYGGEILKVDKETEDGGWIFEVDFQNETGIFTAEVDGYTGEIIEVDEDDDDIENENEDNENDEEDDDDVEEENEADDDDVQNENEVEDGEIDPEESDHED